MCESATDSRADLVSKLCNRDSPRQLGENGAERRTTAMHVHRVIDLTYKHTKLCSTVQLFTSNAHAKGLT